MPLQATWGPEEGPQARAGHALTDSSHLKSFIPKILRMEVDLIQSETAGECLCITFDGTTRLGEAVNICARCMRARGWQ